MFESLRINPSLDQLAEMSSSGMRDELVRARTGLNLSTQFFERLAEQLVPAHKRIGFSSVLSDDLSGRFVARFVRELIAADDKRLPIIPVWVDPNEISSRGAVAGHAAAALIRHRSVIGSNPLIVTELVDTGETLGALVRMLARAGVSPSVATLVTCEGRGFHAFRNFRALTKLGASELFSGGGLDVLSIAPIFRSPVLNGMVKRSAQAEWDHVSELGSPATSWRGTAASEEEALFRQRAVNLARARISEMAREISARMTQSG